MRKMMIWAVVLLSVIVSIGAAQENEVPYKAELSLVENKLKTGDIRGALVDLDQITTKYPNAAEVFYAKGLLFGQMGNYEEAILNAKIAYDKAPNLHNANFLMDLYRRTQQWDDVVELLENFRDKNPQMTFVSRELMGTLAGLKRFDEALKVYDQESEAGRHSDTLDVAKAEVLLRKEDFLQVVSLLKPFDGTSTFGPLYATLAYAYVSQNKSKSAIEILQRGLSLSGDPSLNLDLAEAYKSDKKMRQSFESLLLAFNSEKIDFAEKHRIMIELMNPANKDFSLDQLQSLANTLVLRHPRIAESHVIKGNVLLQRAKVQEARSLFLTAVGINPQYVDAWRMLINADMSINQIDDAIWHSKEALMANPNNPMLMYFAGLSYMMKEDYDNTRKMLELALDRSENENNYLRAMIYGTLGDLYHQLKMHAASDIAYDEAISLDSTNIGVLNNYAYYLALRKKDLEKAEAYSKLTNELEPNSPTLQDTYSWVLFQSGKYSEALQWIEKAIKGSSNSPSAVLYEHYGDILSLNGKVKEAVKQWEKALSISNDKHINVDKIKEKINLKKYVE